MIKTIIFSIALCTSLYLIKKPSYNKQPLKPQSKQLPCERPNVISKPIKHTGRLLDKPPVIEAVVRRFRYETGFPLTGNNYKVIEFYR